MGVLCSCGFEDWLGVLCGRGGHVLFETLLHGLCDSGDISIRIIMDGWSGWVFYGLKSWFEVMNFFIFIIIFFCCYFCVYSVLLDVLPQSWLKKTPLCVVCHCRVWRDSWVILILICSWGWSRRWMASVQIVYRRV